MHMPIVTFSFFFFNDTATTEIYTLSLHDALPICQQAGQGKLQGRRVGQGPCQLGQAAAHGLWQPGRFHRDRKSTRLNTSHSQISYAVFCLKKKKKKKKSIKNKKNRKVINTYDK